MTKKRKEIPQENPRMPSKKQLITISIILAAAIVLAPILYLRFAQTSDVPFSLNAAIIDQLGKEFPNPSVVKNVTDILKTHGFNVAYYNESLTVDFFKGLAKNNYGIIILRVHSALRADNSTVDLFTSEQFDETKHTEEQGAGLVTEGEFLYEPGKYYFALTSSFIENLEGRFPKSVVIAMGCWSLKPGLEQMAKAFVDKGAKAYVGWTDMVLPRDTDRETLRLLNTLLNENETLADSVSQTSKYSYLTYPGNKTIESEMNYYPTSARSLKVSDLIAEVKTKSALKSFDDAKDSPNLVIVNAISAFEKIRNDHIKANNISSLQRRSLGVQTCTYWPLPNMQ